LLGFELVRLLVDFLSREIRDLNSEDSYFFSELYSLEGGTHRVFGCLQEVETQLRLLKGLDILSLTDLHQENRPQELQRFKDEGSAELLQLLLSFLGNRIHQVLESRLVFFGFWHQVVSVGVLTCEVEVLAFQLLRELRVPLSMVRQVNSLNDPLVNLEGFVNEPELNEGNRLQQAGLHCEDLRPGHFLGEELH